MKRIAKRCDIVCYPSFGEFATWEVSNPSHLLDSSLELSKKEIQMAEQGVGNTAIGAAVCWLIEQYQPEEVRLFNDPLVEGLMGAPIRLMTKFAFMRKFILKQTDATLDGIYGAQVCRARYDDNPVQDEVKLLVKRIVERFPSGQIMFDATSKLYLKLQKTNVGISAAGSKIWWGIDNVHELEKCSSKIKLLTDWSVMSQDFPGIQRMSIGVRAVLRVPALIPELKNMGLMLGYQF